MRRIERRRARRYRGPFAPIQNTIAVQGKATQRKSECDQPRFRPMQSISESVILFNAPKRHIKPSLPKPSLHDIPVNLQRFNKGRPKGIAPRLAAIAKDVA